MRVRKHVRVRISDGIESAFVVCVFFSVGSFSFEFQNKVKQNEWEKKLHHQLMPNVIQHKQAKKQIFHISAIRIIGNSVSLFGDNLYYIYGIN